MKKCRTLAGLLALLLVSASCAACASDSKNDKTTTPAAESTAPVTADTTAGSYVYEPDDLPDSLFYDGASIGILSYTEQMLELCEFAENDIVSEAVKKRNQFVEDRLEIKLDARDPNVGWNDYGGYITTLIRSGDDSFELVAGHQDTLFRFQHLGVYYNLDGAPYLDFDKPWWFSDYIAQLQWFPDTVFMVSGDTNYGYIGDLACVFMNKDIITDTFPDVGPDGLYQLVLDGKWTINLFTEYARTACKDLDGNQLIDEEDRYGLVDCYTPKPLIIGMGSRLSGRDGDGLPYLDFDNDRNYAIAEKLVSLYYMTDFYTTAENHEDGTGDTTLFHNGHSAFMLSHVGYSFEYLRTMESEFGILPCPKLDETQENYVSRSAPASSMFTVSHLTSNVDRSCAVLEALASASYRMVLPSYYERALKSKYVYDASSSKVIDIIHDTAYADFADIYGDNVDNPIEKMASTILKGQANLASAFAEIRETSQKAFDKQYGKMEKVR